MAPIKLCYRGASYDYKCPSLEFTNPTNPTIVGQYRGGVWRSSCSKPMTSAQPLVWLHYRGVLYSTGTSLPIAWLQTVKRTAERAVERTIERSG